jgi:osmoprotectant transport system permease protein
LDGSTPKKHLLNPDAVTITGSAIGIFALFLNWFTLRPNRLAEGTNLSLGGSVGWHATAILGLLWLACLVSGFLLQKRRQGVTSGFCANLILILVFVFSGLAGNTIISQQHPGWRLSLGAGVWLTLLAVYTVLFSSRRKLDSLLFQNLILWPGILIALGLLLSGFLNNLSIMQEFLGQKARFGQELWHHIYLVSISVALGLIAGFLLGLWAARARLAKAPIFFITNIIQTIPSLALFGLLIAPLSALSFAMPALRNLGISGIGDTPALIALVIYSLLPIVQNTFTGLTSIDPGSIDAAEGMGMNRLQKFLRVEAPLSAPVIIEGIRIAAVQCVGLAAVAALIGAGGLGWFIFQGLGQAAPDLILLGAIPIIVMALVVDTLMRWLGKMATPQGMVIS